jgi:very-short-patch-repair endonuclease
MHLWTPDFVPRIVGENIHCVPPVTAWAQMSKYVEFDELVVLGDSMMRKDVRLKQASLDDFAQFIQNSPRFIGKGKCVRAVPLLAENTDSSQESRLRLLLMHRHLGRPEVNYAVYDRENQQRYLLDLAYPSHHVALEYDGEQHAIDKVQRRNDIFKRNQLEQMGWTVITAYKEDLVESDRVELLVSKILLAFARQST